jgi:hypothetical protein
MSIRESLPLEALELCDKLEMLEIWSELKASDQYDFAQELTKDIESPPTSFKTPGVAVQRWPHPRRHRIS